MKQKLPIVEIKEVVAINMILLSLTYTQLYTHLWEDSLLVHGSCIKIGKERHTFHNQAPNLEHHKIINYLRKD